MKTIKSEKAYVLFLVPAIVIYGVFLVIPMLSSFGYSLTDWDGLSKKINFIGLANFKFMLSDEGFRMAIRNTVIFVFMDVIIQNVMGLILALLIEHIRKTKNIIRGLFFIPVVMPPIVVSFVWSYLYNYNNGVFNNLLLKLGLGRIDFIGDPKCAIYFVIISGIWQWLTYRMIIYVSGLQSIPQEVIEAAKVDGANKAQSFFKVTLPLLIPAISINVILCTIGALKQFDVVFTMTNGGPGYATEVITTKIYREAFTNMDMGYGAATGVVLFIAIMVITIGLNKFFKSREVDF